MITGPEAVRLCCKQPASSTVTAAARGSIPIVWVGGIYRVFHRSSLHLHLEHGQESDVATMGGMHHSSASLLKRAVYEGRVLVTLSHIR